MIPVNDQLEIDCNLWEAYVREPLEADYDHHRTLVIGSTVKSCKKSTLIEASGRTVEETSNDHDQDFAER